MKKILLFTLFSLSLSCSNDEDTKSNNDDKTVDEIPTTISKIKKITITENDIFSTEISYEYNDQDYLNSTTTIYSNGYRRKISYQYKDDMIISTTNITYTTTDSIAEEFIRYFEYEGDLIKKSTSIKNNQTESIIYTYNSNKDLIENETFIDGIPYQKEIFTYSNGNPINKKQYSYNPSIQKYISIYVESAYFYDEKINPEYYIFPIAYTKISLLVKNNKIYNNSNLKKYYEYNNYGYPIKSTSIVHSKTLVFIYEYY